MTSQCSFCLPSGQLQAALERRRSFGRTRNLAVDEEVAKGGREKGRGGIGAVADFMRRSFKKTKSRDEPKYEEEIIRIDENSSTTKPQEEVSYWSLQNLCRLCSFLIWKICL